MIFTDPTTPNIDEAQLQPVPFDGPAPKVLLLYGSLRDTSYSRMASEECARILQKLGADTNTFVPTDLPLPDSAKDSHPKVQELRDKVTACDAMVWVSPERHGAMTGIMKAQIDWIPLSLGGVRPTQGKVLAVGQVNGGSQSFNTVNQLRILGRWMRLLTIPNQFSTAKAWDEFPKGRMRASPYYNRMVDVMEELMRFTVLTRDIRDGLVDRYSERVETAEQLSKRVNQAKL